MRLLLKWNKSISLTSIMDPAEIVARHFGESMYASKLLPVENCRLADVGTGAGFPGLALKIACPGIHLTLIESNKKKCAFLSEVVRTLEFRDVEIRPERFEEIRPEALLQDIITCRAVGEFKQLLRWSAKALARRGHLVLWVGAEDSTRIASTPVGLAAGSAHPGFSAQIYPDWPPDRGICLRINKNFSNLFHVEQFLSDHPVPV